MADWNDLNTFVRVRYEIMRQREDELWFTLPTTGERTQIVAVRKVVGDDDHPWAVITSPVGQVGRIDLEKALARGGEAVVGGLVIENGLVLFRHSIPLPSTGLDGFERPFRKVVEIADRMEHELTGADEH